MPRWGSQSGGERERDIEREGGSERESRVDNRHIISIKVAILYDLPYT
jgi:hypothetical protein